MCVCESGEKGGEGDREGGQGGGREKERVSMCVRVSE